MRSVLVFALLFWAAAASADIQPRSGPWTGTFEYRDSTDCPKQVVEKMQTMPAAERSYSEELVFPSPFTPDALPSREARFTWRRVGPDAWQGTFAQSKSTVMGKIVTVADFSLNVRSEVEMDQQANFTVTLPKRIARMAGMGGTTCVLRSVIEHRYTGR